MTSGSKSSGTVYLVGAGPGDPGLITLRGIECLQRADCVLYDYLVNPRILHHARPEAERICLGRHGRSRIWSQEEVNREIVRRALDGQCVVRLKGGDPAVFARVAEETDALHAAGIPFEIVPGITAALAAGSFAGIPVTDRRLASAVALVTGQQGGGKGEPPLDYEAIARFPGTLVFYMGVTTVRSWTEALLAHGKPAKTPAAIVRRCSLPDQIVIRTTLDHVAAELTPATRLRPPVVVIVGEVAGCEQGISWFERRPLFGHTILVTRPEEQAADLERPLSELGAQVLSQPAIRIDPPDDWSDVDQCLADLPDYDWLVFSSANGVRYLLDRLRDTGRDLRALGGVKLAAIGPGTDRELGRYHLRADLQPEAFRAESLAESLAPYADGGRFLLARASRGREVLAEQLREAGAKVSQTVVYHSRDVREPDREIRRQLQGGRIDWVTVTSSAIARSLAAMFGDDLHRARLVSISPITSSTLRQLGFEPSAEATTYTMPGVVEALVQAARQGPSTSSSR